MGLSCRIKGSSLESGHERSSLMTKSAIDMSVSRV